MTDFAALIERSIERDLRDRFVTFLTNYRHVEFGRVRGLMPDELALVLTCTDKFLLTANPLSLGVCPIARVRDRLQQIANLPVPDSVDQVTANTAFDALACITALEARLSRVLDRSQLDAFRPASCQAQRAANDR